MRALIFNDAGNPEKVLELKEIEKPVPGPDEVLIRVSGSPIHPADIMFIQGKYRYKPEFPQTAGLEGAGIINAVGKNAKLKTGMLAAFMNRKSWAEYIVVHENEIIILPDDFPKEKAVQFCLNPFTAWGLLDESALKAGDWLIVTAGNSIVSRIIIQLAKLRKINTIAVVRNLEESDELKLLGAVEVLSIGDDQFSQKIMSLTAGSGFNAALDSVGGKTGTLIFQNIAPNGRIIIYGLLSNDPVQFYNSQIVFKNLFVKGFGIRGYLQSQTRQKQNEMLNELTNEIAKSSFFMPVMQSFRLNQYKEALAANSHINRKGKIIFQC